MAAAMEDYLRGSILFLSETQKEGRIRFRSAKGIDEVIPFHFDHLDLDARFIPDLQFGHIVRFRIKEAPMKQVDGSTYERHAVDVSCFRYAYGNYIYVCTIFVSPKCSGEK